MPPGPAGPAGPSADTLLIETGAALADVIERASQAPRVAVDVESNGLFAYRPALCVLQLAWREGRRTEVAVIDTLVVPAAPLAGIFGAEGPEKVLHDLTLDAQLLAAAGAPLARVRDTSVGARLLGRKATGLAALLAEELGVEHDKHLQHRDWGLRPLDDDAIAYLAGDVRYLLDLDEQLEIEAEAIDVAPEIADECAYKLATALAPRREPRPGWIKQKGAGALSPLALATLRALWAAREAAADRDGVPPFKIAGSDLLMEIAARRPASIEALAAIRGALAGPSARYVEAWLGAVAGAREGDVTAEERAWLAPRPPSREELARRRVLGVKLSRWRRAEAARRGIHEQAVLPGHCADDLIDALAAHPPGAGPVRAVIAGIPGIGARRLLRYGDALAALAES